MTDRQYAHINRWNVLFDELCERAGFVDNASIASRFCELANNGSGQRDFETTLRNLNNWRSGRHIPRLRSLRILEQLLKLDEEPRLSAHWLALYRQAGEAEEREETTTQKGGPASRTGGNGDGAGRGSREWPDWRQVAAGAALFGLGLGTGMLFSSDWRPWGGPADNAPLIAYTPEVEMTVGESRVIHAERGDCGKLPREWPDVAGSLPASFTGVFSDGGLARRNSKFCGGETPARAIVFTAHSPGVEEFLIQGDFFKVTVAEAASLPATDAGTATR